MTGLGLFDRPVDNLSGESDGRSNCSAASTSATLLAQLQHLVWRSFSAPSKASKCMLDQHCMSADRKKGPCYSEVEPSAKRAPDLEDQQVDLMPSREVTAPFKREGFAALFSRMKERSSRTQQHRNSSQRHDAWGRGTCPRDARQVPGWPAPKAASSAFQGILLTSLCVSCSQSNQNEGCRCASGPAGGSCLGPGRHPPW